MEHISASQITLYLLCPLKYRFRYIDKFVPAFKNSSLAFGSAVHSALAWWHEELMAGSTPPSQEAQRIFRADWQAELAEKLRFKSSETPQSLSELGEGLIELYIAEHRNIKVQAVEKLFYVPLIDPETGEVFEPHMKGYLDLLLTGDVLVELKTAAKAYTNAVLARHIQLSAYAYTYRQLYGRDAQIRVVVLLKQKKPSIKIYTATRPPASDRWFIHLAGSVIHAIKAGAFPPNTGWMCNDCEYEQQCIRWYEIATPKVQHQPLAVA